MPVELQLGAGLPREPRVKAQYPYEDQSDDEDAQGGVDAVEHVVVPGPLVLRPRLHVRQSVGARQQVGENRWTKRGESESEREEGASEEERERENDRTATMAGVRASRFNYSAADVTVAEERR